MKRMIIVALIAITCLTGFDFYQDRNMVQMKATAYCLHGTTYTGKHTRHGIAATGNKKLLGMTAIVYQRLPDGQIGDCIGIYEIEDTGCKENVIDVWCEDLDECQDFMDAVYADGCKSNVWCELIDAKG